MKYPTGNKCHDNEKLFKRITIMKTDQPSNHKNARFYDSGFTTEGLKDQAIVCGIYDMSGHCPDLEDTRRELQRTFPEKHGKMFDVNGTMPGSILVAGTGFGREISWMLKNASPFLDITAVDHAKRIVREVGLLYAKHPQVHVVQQNILDLPHSWKGKFDLVLWMWSGIVEFLGDEKETALLSLADMLRPDGILVLEKLSHVANVKIKTQFHTEGQFVIVEGDNATQLVTEQIEDRNCVELFDKIGLHQVCNPVHYLQNKRIIFFVTKAKPNDEV